MPRFAIEIKGKELIVECRSKPAAMSLFNSMGYRVAVPDIKSLDPSPYKVPKRPPKVTVTIRPPVSAIEDLVSLGINEKAVQKNFFVEAGLEKIERMKMARV